jgi:hypothetical protein
MTKPQSTTVETFFLYGTLGISSLLIFILAAFAKELSITSAIALPLVLIFGVIDVFIVLTLAGKIFVNTNYGCRDEALGLPAGSVRALIALSLIIIFAIMAIFMYNTLTPGGNQLVLSANETVVFPNGTTLTNPNANTYVLIEPNQAQRDFSSQTLTTVSTLVVALAGFYFGTKAVESAKGKESSGEPLSIKPDGTVKAKKGEAVPIIVESDPDNEKINFEVKGDNKDTLKQSDKNSKLYEYIPSGKGPLAVLEFSWASNPQISKSLIVQVENSTMQNP